MKYLLSFFITIFFFTLTYQSTPAEFSSIDLLAIGFLIVVVSAGEVLIARIFSRYRILENYILAGFTVFNILFLNLVFVKEFVALPSFGQVIVLLVGIFVVAALFEIIENLKLIAKVLPTLFAMASIIVILVTVVAVVPTNLSNSNEPGMTSAEKIRLVKFALKPNVYFVSFDSLIPKVLLRNYIGLESTPYHGVLSANFQRFNNFFADRNHTKISLNSLLALDMDYFDKAFKEKTYLKFFSGRRPSPLLEIFKYNGYETTTYYRSNIFGKFKGPFVDNYLIEKSKSGHQINDRWWFMASL